MNFTLYKRLWKDYILKYRKSFILSIAVSLMVAGLTGAIAWLIQPALDKIFIEKNRTMLYLIPVAVVLLYLLKGALSYLQGYLMAYIGQNIITDIRNDIYRKIIYLPIREYNRHTTGSLSARVFYEVNVLQNVVSGGIKDTVQQVFTIATLTVVIFTRDWKLATIAVMALPLTAVLIGKMGRKIKRLITDQNEMTGDIFSTLHDTLSSPRIIKAFRAEEKEVGNFETISDGMKRLVMKVARVRSLSSPLMEFLGSVGIAGTILYGGYQVINGVTTPGNFFSFMAALLMFYNPIKTLSSSSNSFQMAMVSAERIFEILDMENEEKDLLDPSKRRLDGVKDGIEYRGVTFRYDHAPGDTLKGIDLDIRAGEVVAFVGSSGAGKTTTVNLLPRFYDPDGGGIYIDGVNIRDYNLASLRDNISMVTQDVMLFNDTARYNIAYGRDGAPEEAVVAAARAAYAHDFITAMSGGYDSVIGEKGMKLSGGEKQRIAIARAIHKDAPILILDEATSSLDSESEGVVQKALENLMKGRTTLVIAHRLSTVRNADKIAVFDDGRIVEAGTHAELMRRGAHYRRLHDLQYFYEEKPIPA